jgi:hypothetical protein
MQDWCAVYIYTGMPRAMNVSTQLATQLIYIRIIDIYIYSVPLVFSETAIFKNLLFFVQFLRSARFLI